MKSKLLIAIAALMVMTLGVVAFAYNRSNTVSATAKDCCAKKDHCPMKMKSDKADSGKASAAEAAAKDCCAKKDSCPMKMKSEKADSTMAVTAEAVNGKASSCCCAGGSCPMMGKEKAEGDHAKHSEEMKEHSCCCDCCSKEKTETARL